MWLALHVSAGCGSNADAHDAEVMSPNGTATRCDEDGGAPAAGIASVRLSETLPLQLTETAQLIGDEVAATLMPLQTLSGLRWQEDRMFLLADTGFWDISTEGEARWYATSSTLVMAARAADLDGDGDQDLLLLTADINDASGTDDLASPLVSRVSVWERMPDGLTERAEVLRLPYVILPVPYEVGDLDGDGVLDVASYEHGAPVGYMNDGAFGFTRRVLGDTAPEYDNPLAMVFSADRNRDGALDLLVATGEELEISVFVILGDGAGRFGAPGPATIVEAPLVPHGPNGVGFWFADVTADGIEDVVTQDAQSTDEAPVLNLFISESATRLAPAMQLDGLGFEFGDVDEDGSTDLVTTRDGQLVALLARGDGRFEARELGIRSSPPVKDFALEHGEGREPVLHVLYDLSACPACDSGCSGRCIFDACVAVAWP